MDVKNETMAGFLLARIAEDEVDAFRDFGTDDSPGTWTRYVLAECEAKRRIAEFAESWRGDANDYGQTDYVLKLLAVPYADHADYREEWKP